MKRLNLDALAEAIGEINDQLPRPDCPAEYAIAHRGLEVGYAIAQELRRLNDNIERMMTAGLAPTLGNQPGSNRHRVTVQGSRVTDSTSEQPGGQADG